MNRIELYKARHESIQHAALALHRDLQNKGILGRGDELTVMVTPADGESDHYIRIGA